MMLRGQAKAPPGGSVAPAVGQIWHRRGGRERVEITRAWDSTIAGTVPTPAVRCRPLHGGKQWWAYVTDFLERFDVA
jgi:hypothetical protein